MVELELSWVQLLLLMEVVAEDMAVVMEEGEEVVAVVMEVVEEGQVVADERSMYCMLYEMANSLITAYFRLLNCPDDVLLISTAGCCKWFNVMR